MQSDAELINVINLNSTSEFSDLQRLVYPILNRYTFEQLYDLQFSIHSTVNRITASANFIALLSAQALKAPIAIPQRVSNLSFDQLLSLPSIVHQTIQQICDSPVYNHLLNQRALEELHSINWRHVYDALIVRMGAAGYIKTDMLDDNHRYGLAMMWLQAWHGGIVGAFWGLLNDILKIKVEDFKNYLQIMLIENRHLVTHECKKLRLRANILALFDGITLYQRPNDFLEMFGQSVNNYTGLNKSISWYHHIIHEWLGNITYYKLDHLDINSPGFLRYSAYLLGHFVRQDIPLSLLLSNNRQTISINYDFQNHQWVLIDSKQCFSRRYTKVSTLFAGIIGELNNRAGVSCSADSSPRSPGRQSQETHFSLDLNNLIQKSKRLESIIPNNKKKYLVDATIFISLNQLKPANQALAQLLREHDIYRNHNEPQSSMHFSTYQHYSEFLIACKTGNLLVVFSCLDDGEDVNQCDAEGRTPLIIATRERHISVVRALLARGANIHLKDRYGINALMHAVTAKSHAITSLLLQYGATGNVFKGDLTTVFTYAVKTNDPIIVAKVLSHGAISDLSNRLRVPIILSGSLYYLLNFKSDNGLYNLMPSFVLSASAFMVVKYIDYLYNSALDIVCKTKNKDILRTLFEYASKQHSGIQSTIFNWPGFRPAFWGLDNDDVPRNKELNILLKLLNNQLSAIKVSHQRLRTAYASFFLWDNSMEEAIQSLKTVVTDRVGCVTPKQLILLQQGKLGLDLHNFVLTGHADSLVHGKKMFKVSEWIETLNQLCLETGLAERRAVEA
ncbi:MAG: ankyrin repeat domain-containing protein [Legionellaceae bacterium]|nr:ankyrin repeat domain-containing protein [Legionellaceae bacterium]